MGGGPGLRFAQDDSIKQPRQKQIPYPPQRANSRVGDPDYGNDKQKNWQALAEVEAEFGAGVVGGPGGGWGG